MYTSHLYFGALLVLITLSTLSHSPSYSTRLYMNKYPLLVNKDATLVLDDSLLLYVREPVIKAIVLHATPL